MTEPSRKEPKLSYIDVVDGIKTNVRHNDQWVQNWTDGKIGFHEKETHPLLVKYLERLTNGKKIKFFIPLCGKAVDMKWLADLGHSVVGVEYVPQAIEEFFAEQEVEYTIEECESYPGKLYKSLDNQIRIYCGDIYDFKREVEGSFDAIFDRASLVAINRCDRKKYVSLMHSLLTPEGACIIEVWEYNEGVEMLGPPHAVFKEEMNDLYGKEFDFEILETNTDEARRERFKVSSLLKVTYYAHIKRNKITEVDGVKTKVLKNDDWIEDWEKGKTGWHDKQVHEQLMKYIDRLTNGNKVKFLIPLCGKTVDMKWLAGLGHTVIGVEYVAKGIEEFFGEQEIEYTIEDSQTYPGKMYKSVDGNIRIYCGDIFKFTSETEGTFDAIFDRASLIAINRPDRVKYVSLMQSLLSPDGTCLIETFTYDEGVTYFGPPHSVSKDELGVLYGKDFNIELLELFEDEIYRKVFKQKSFVKSYYLTTLKSEKIQEEKLTYVSTEDGVRTKNVLNDAWVARWDIGRIGFHSPECDRSLVKYEDLLSRGKKITFFIPMCGKSVAMKWLADLGHTVVGVEFVELAIVQFFTEHGLKYIAEDRPDIKGKLFTSDDRKIKLFCCDIFNFSREVAGQIDAIFDRGALVAINRCDRQRYANLMKSLLGEHGKYLLEVLEYDEGKTYLGPPHSVTSEDINRYFAEDCQVVLLESFAEEEDEKKFKTEYFNTCIYSIQMKSILF